MKIKIKEILTYAEIFLLIQLTLGPINIEYRMFLYIILLIFNHRYLNSLIRIGKFWLIFFPVATIPLVLDIVNVDSATPYSLAGLYYFFPFIVCKIWTKKYSYKEFFYYFEKIAFFCCVVSLIGFALVCVAPNIIELFPTIDYGGRNGGVNTIIIYNAIRRAPGLPGFLFRNCGISFEPGAFQFVPNLALAYLFENKGVRSNKYYLKITIYILTVASTLSTTGVAILAVIIAVNFFNRKNTLYFIIGTVILSPGVLYVILYQMDKLATGNFLVRFGNSLYVLQNYSKYFWGIGSTGYNKIYAVNRTIGSWDLYTNLFLRFGWGFIILFIYLNIRLFKLGKSIMIVCLMTFLTESLIGPATVMLYYYCDQIHISNQKLRSKPTVAQASCEASVPCDTYQIDRPECLQEQTRCVLE